MHDKAVDTICIPDRYVTQEFCDKVVSEDPFMLKYCHDKYKTQKMCDNVAASCLIALKLTCYE